MLKEKNAVTIMDAACGTGVDSVMLIEEMGNNPGFHLTSFNILSEKSQEVRWKPGLLPISSISMTESTPVPQAASMMVTAFFSLSMLIRKFL